MSQNHRSLRDGLELPSDRTVAAIRNGVANEILFVVGGGLGDRLCAEPTIRYALSNFPEASISVACVTPELFFHLPVKMVFDFEHESPNPGNYLLLYTHPENDSLFHQFVSSHSIHCVDVAGLHALRMQIPDPYRRPRLKVDPMLAGDLHGYSRCVFLHVGQTWASRTLPAEWWNRVIVQVLKRGLKPVLIGKNCIPDLAADQCLDLRDKTDLRTYLALCQGARRMITNDSSAMHIACTGPNRVCYVPTCKRPDYLRHQGEGLVQNYFSGPRKMWTHFIPQPNSLDPGFVTDLPPGTSWDDFLPDPESIVEAVAV